MSLNFESMYPHESHVGALYEYHLLPMLINLVVLRTGAMSQEDESGHFAFIYLTRVFLLTIQE